MSTRPDRIPLRPSADALAANRARSFARAYAAITLGMLKQKNSADILRAGFADDDFADLVLRVATNPATLASFPQFSPLRVLGDIAPTSTALKLFARSLQIDLTGLYAAKVARGSTKPVPIYVGEAQPIPDMEAARALHALNPAQRQQLSQEQGQQMTSDVVSIGMFDRELEELCDGVAELVVPLEKAVKELRDENAALRSELTVLASIVRGDVKALKKNNDAA